MAGNDGNIDKIDWTRCFICQCGTTEKLRSTEDGRKKLAKMLPKFSEVNGLDFDPCRLEPISTLEETLHLNNASYHHTCAIKYSQRMLDRAIERQNRKGKLEEKDPSFSGSPSGPPCKRRSQVHREIPDKSICCFCKEEDFKSNLCAAGTYHATKNKANSSHVNYLTEKWKKMAEVVEDDELLRMLSAGDVAANEIFYHRTEIKCCLQTFNWQFERKISQKNKDNEEEYETEWKKLFALNKIFYYMCEEEKEHPASVFEAKVLEDMYLDLLREDEIHYVSHVTHFVDLLLSKHPNLEKRHAGKKLVIYFKETVDTLLTDALAPSPFIRLLHDVVIPLRKLIASKESHFNGTFDLDSQVKSIPIQMLTLISMLVDGPGTSSHISQPSLTISQLIVSNFKQEGNSDREKVQRRGNRSRETPVQIYSSLKIYGSLRSKTLIDHFFQIGICVSYPRVLEITKFLSDAVINQYAENEFFSPRSVKKQVFTMIAKDNVDKNATSSTATTHYHGISMTIMQFPTEKCPGEDQPALPLETVKTTTSKKVQPLPSSYTEVKPLFMPKQKNLYAPPCNMETSLYADNELYENARQDELFWLTSVYENFQTDYINIHSWSSHHANEERTNTGMKGINAILPLIPKPVHTLESQHHCMEIIKRTINYLNPGQTIVDVCDQPVFALTKEIQFRKPDLFGIRKYFSLLGALHIEHCLLCIHGELIKGSGLYEILANNNLSIIGTGAIVNANHIKQARYCLQVALCAIYIKLRTAHKDAESGPTAIEWLQEKAEHSQMCFYWSLILNLQIDILLFVRAIRESNFHLYVLSMKNLMKCFFSMDHYHYARWGSVHLFDLMHLHITSSDVYNEFTAGNFSFQKTMRQFSSMAPDQLHEQNNEVIKGVGGATHLLNRQNESGLERWEVCGPELARLLSEFEEMTNFPKTPETKHHEDAPAFQKRFASDVNKVFEGMMVNPFELGNLTKINNTNIVFDDKVFKDLTLLLTEGQSQFNTFWEERLLKGEKPINGPITKNTFCLPGKFEDQQRENEKKLNYSPALLTKLRSALHVRKELTAQLFKTELFGVAQSLAETNVKLYHGNKAEIMKRFSAVDSQSTCNEMSALVGELSPLVQSQNTENCRTFVDLAHSLYSRISELGKGCSRLDIIADRYFQHSLKKNMRETRGIGSKIKFSDDTQIPSNFQTDFLKNSENKDELYRYLACKFIDFHSSGDQVLVVTHDSSILTTATNLEASGISYCTSEEADQRVVRHVLNIAQSKNFDNVLVTTSDTDVFLLLLAFYPLIKEIDGPSIICRYGIGANTQYYSINAIAEEIGFNICKALPFFHAFSGCDTVSSFFKHSKALMWDSWMKYPTHGDLTRVFQELSEQPEEVLPSHVDVIEGFVKFVYYSKTDLDSLDTERMNHFMRLADSNLRSIPPSRSGLQEHIKRAVLQGGWIWQEAVSNVPMQDPNNWGWLKKNEKYIPKWQLEPSIDIRKVCQVCTCQKAICKKCKCAKDNVKCLPFCGCHQKCNTK